MKKPVKLELELQLQPQNNISLSSLGSQIISFVLSHWLCRYERTEKKQICTNVIRGDTHNTGLGQV